MANNNEFRVIIAGGGPVALVAMHALNKAGIDSIILEKRNALDVLSGASLAVWPHNVRILDQLGLLQEAESIYLPVLKKHNLRRDGSEISRSNMFEAIEINHGHKWMCFHRAKLMTMLYETMPNKETKVFTNKEVVAIETTETGVTVTCADKTTYSGSMVLGADGVHSAVRRLINEQATSTGAKLTSKQQDPFLTSYRALYGYADKMDSLLPTVLYETHSDKMTIQVIVGEKSLHFAAYERLAKPTKERARFSAEDQDSFAKKYADVRFSDSVTMGDIWAAKRWSSMNYLEEGVVETWHGGRAVLVGDAAHKMTPNAGFGMNSGMQGVVQLVNRLRALLQISPAPDAAELTRVFEDYQTDRMKETKDIVYCSGLYTRLVAWNNPVWKFADQHVLPHVNGDVMALRLLMSPIVKRGETLDFLEEREFKEGKVAWNNGQRTVKAQE
ncbi:FAD binding domain-containing protein [Pseudomassariella vexata]|uniref:FAD binding domain-containing protein n=1 Tax=Pseudomassariella vexata TaxID=1141098 RepID=A0A1Y2EA89_9PEZI|nr:FAD binding domain-containing protein [Pseudomassariella vexata]ORY68469.1 FAD binding domain-containing protein [Pseudomassariella vexata]